MITKMVINQAIFGYGPNLLLFLLLSRLLLMFFIAIEQSINLGYSQVLPKLDMTH